MVSALEVESRGTGSIPVADTLDFDLKPPLLLISALSPETAGFKSQGLK